MKYYLLIPFLFIITAASSQTITDSQIKEADKLIQQLKEESESIGWTLSVSINDKIVYSKGFGLGHYEQQIQVYPDKTKFRIGSISKSLTAAALGILMEKKQIDIDRGIQEYVTYFPRKEYPITTRQVAGHIAGIRHYKGTEFLSDKHYNTVKAGLDMFKDDPLLFEPGTSYRYSSHGFNLLSAAIEGASNEEFLEYMQVNVFEPLGMNQTIADHIDSLIIYRAGFYGMSDGKNLNATYVDNSYKWAGGGFLSTSEDLLKFGNAMLYDRLFSEGIKMELITSQKMSNGKETGYGIGFFSGVNEFGRTYYGHSGGSIGGCGNLLIYPDEKLVIAVITNDSRAKIGDDIHRVAEIFMKE